MRFHLRRWFFICLLFGPHAAALADGLSILHPPRAVDPDWQDWPMPGGNYDRYQFPVVGADIGLFFDEDNLPNDGDTWSVALRDLENSDPADVYTLVYDGVFDCLIDAFGTLACGIVATAEGGGVVDLRYVVWYAGECMKENAYQMDGSYNGVPMSAAPYPVLPVDFKPGIPEVAFQQTRVMPHVPSSIDKQNGMEFSRSYDPGLDAGVFNISLRVKDDLGCGFALDDEKLKVRSVIVPGSGSHRHFSDAELPGTGTLSIAGGPSAPKHDPALEFEMDGPVVNLTYEAGEYALRERMEFEAVEAQVPAIATQEIEISVVDAVGEFAQLSGQGNWYAVSGSGAEGCDAGHNESASVRDSDYLIPRVRNSALALAYDFFDRTGLKLSFNDASLQSGGFFDGGLPDRSRRCHATHRVGTDVDLNGTPVNPALCAAGTGPRLENCMIQEFGYGEAEPALLRLDELAEKTYGAHYWRDFDREVSPVRIHYRFAR